MAYAGSLEPLDHTETGYHGLIEGEVSDEETDNLRSLCKENVYTSGSHDIG